MFIIRAWVEEGSTAPLRAEVRRTGDVSVGFDYAWTYADVEAVGDEVQEWLQEILGAQ